MSHSDSLPLLALTDQQILQGNQALGQVLSARKNFLGGRRKEEDKKELSNLAVFFSGIFKYTSSFGVSFMQSFAKLMPFRYVWDCEHTAAIVGDEIQRGLDSIG